MGVRDPLSVAYDSRVRRVLLRAIIARRSDRGIPAFVQSPPREFRAPDRGGRTKHERAFTRSAYYQVFKVPRNLGELPAYSLRLDWGKIEFRHGRWGRVVQVRLFRYGSGRRHAEQAGRQWITDDALRSVPGNRIDA
jgi:hypothetical protein